MKEPKTKDPETKKKAPQQDELSEAQVAKLSHLLWGDPDFEGFD